MRTLYRTPDRVPPGKHLGIIKSIQIATRQSQKGNQYESLSIELSVMYEDYGLLMPMYFNIPFFWNPDSTLVRVAKSFDILPEIGEEFKVQTIVNMVVEVAIEENVYNGKLYSNIIDMAPFKGDVPVQLQEWLDQQAETRQKTDTLFDDESGNAEDEPIVDNSHANEEENCGIMEDEGEEEPVQVSSKPSPPQPASSNPYRRRNPIGSRSGIPIKKSLRDNEGFGDL